MEDVLDAIGNVVDKKGGDLVHSFRDNGKWRSITVQVPVVSAEQLYEVRKDAKTWLLFSVAPATTDDNTTDIYMQSDDIFTLAHI